MRIYGIYTDKIYVKIMAHEELNSTSSAMWTDDEAVYPYLIVIDIKFHVIPFCLLSHQRKTM